MDTAHDVVHDLEQARADRKNGGSDETASQAVVSGQAQRQTDDCLSENQNADCAADDNQGRSSNMSSGAAGGQTSAPWRRAIASISVRAG